MKKTRKKRCYIIFSLIALWMLSLAACSQEEEVLFVESSSQTDEVVSGETATDESVSGKTGAEAGKSPDGASPVEAEQTAVIFVHVCGAVNNPGVYELAQESRVIDAVSAAGGMTESADEEYVNLVTVLTDGDKVRIPTKEEVTNMSQAGCDGTDMGVTNRQTAEMPEKGTKDADLVNINTADVELLCTLPGIGQTRAESIVAYRNEHGAFSSIEDIMLVSGIKESSFQKIKDRITV